MIAGNGMHTSFLSEWNLGFLRGMVTAGVSQLERRIVAAPKGRTSTGIISGRATIPQ